MARTKKVFHMILTTFSACFWSLSSPCTEMRNTERACCRTSEKPQSAPGKMQKVTRVVLMPLRMQW